MFKVSGETCTRASPGPRAGGGASLGPGAGAGRPPALPPAHRPEDGGITILRPDLASHTSICTAAANVLESVV